MLAAGGGKARAAPEAQGSAMGNCPICQERLVGGEATPAPMACCGQQVHMECLTDFLSNNVYREVESSGDDQEPPGKPRCVLCNEELKGMSASRIFNLDGIQVCRKRARAEVGGGGRGRAEAARRIAKAVKAADVVLALLPMPDAPMLALTHKPMLALTYKPAGRTRVVACAFIDDLGSVLLTRRGSRCKDYVGYWHVPGGKVKEGEDDVDAAVREAREEVRMRSLSVIVVGELRLEEPDIDLVVAVVTEWDLKYPPKMTREADAVEWKHVDDMLHITW